MFQLQLKFVQIVIIISVQSFETSTWGIVCSNNIISVFQSAGFDKSRECIVFDEETDQRLPFFDLPTVPGYKFLQTGDLGRMNMCSKCSDFNSLLFVERIDRLCKRNGTRVDLTLVELKAMGVAGVKQSHCFEWMGKLVLLVKPSENEHSSLGQEVHEALRASLTIESQPDEIVVFDGTEPIGANGKLDVKTIMNSVRNVMDATAEKQDVKQIYHLKTEEVAALFDEMWQFYTKVKPTDKFAGDSFISCGGNSMSAMRFVEDFFTKIHQFGSRKHSENEKNLIRCLIFLSYEEAKEEFVKFMKKLNYEVVVRECKGDTNPLVQTDEEVEVAKASSNGVQPKSSKMGVSVKFPLGTTDFTKYALGLCVDAAPVLFKNEPGATSTSCLIGSHSGDLCCFNLESLDFEPKCCVTDKNVPLWQKRFPGRLESSVVLDSEGCAYVGCHSGDIMKLNTSTGKTVWSFMLGFEVRSSPALDPLERYLIVCSTQHVYCIDAKVGTLVWVHKSDAYIPQNFSALATKEHVIFVTSKGLCSTALNADSGSGSWQTEHEAICTSPTHVLTSSTSVIVFGTGDGCVEAVSEVTGEEIWRFDLLDHGLQPSPPNEFQVYHRAGTVYLLFSTHSGNIVCLDASTGALCGTCDIGTACRSRPLVMSGKDGNNVQVIVSSLNSKLYSCLFELDSQKTEVEDVLAVFGVGNSECFSSPVLASDLGIIVVGCRDNFVYFFKLEQTK